jgi:hypothetical protein
MATNHVQDLERCRYRGEEVARDDGLGMVLDERTPSLPNRLPRPPALLYVFAYGTRIYNDAEFERDSSSAMRPSPQHGFSSAIVMMSARRFLGSGGRPSARDFHRQNSRNPPRCQRTNVLGLTIASACAHGKNRLKTTSASFAAGVGRRRRAFRSW